MRFAVDWMNTVRKRLRRSRLNHEYHRFKLAAGTVVRKVKGRSDYQKWSPASSLSANWDPRTERIASLVPPGTSVIEFGAGMLVLRNHLPEGCTYTPSDIVDRGEGTLVLDLNMKVLPDLQEGYDVAVFSGVLEYIHNVPRLISHLSNVVPHIITSYAVVDITPSLFKRRSLGWVNDFSSKEIKELFLKQGFGCEHVERWHNQEIYRFVRQKKAP